MTKLDSNESLVLLVAIQAGPATLENNGFFL